MGYRTWRMIEETEEQAGRLATAAVGLAEKIRRREVAGDEPRLPAFSLGEMRELAGSARRVQLEAANLARHIESEISEAEASPVWEGARRG